MKEQTAADTSAAGVKDKAAPIVERTWKRAAGGDDIYQFHTEVV
jgi:hypothetical protein